MADDYAQLATRMSSFTTKCMLTGIVLVAGLGFGRQVLQWWAEEESPDGGPIGVADGLGDPLRPHLLQFGDLPWSLQRQTVVGPKQAAAAALREICLRAVREEEETIPDGDPGKAERKLLAELAARRPVASEPGRWALYELDEGFPMIVATRSTAAAERGGRDLRITTWGLAFPADSDAWAVCTFHPGTPSGKGEAAIVDKIIPPDCTRTLSVRVVGGGAVVGFCGSGRAETWKNRFDSRFTGNNWRMVGQWRNTGAAWHARYEKGDLASGTAVDVHFGPSFAGSGDAGAAGRFSGLLVFTPSGAAEEAGP